MAKQAKVKAASTQQRNDGYTLILAERGYASQAEIIRVLVGTAKIKTDTAVERKKEKFKKDAGALIKAGAEHPDATEEDKIFAASMVNKDGTLRSRRFIEGIPAKESPQIGLYNHGMTYIKGLAPKRTPEEPKLTPKEKLQEAARSEYDEVLQSMTIAELKAERERLAALREAKAA